MDKPIRTVTPIQSPADTRSYRFIELSNGLQALLIHDETADKASASLDVKVGQIFDPEEAQGLAHFLEHMLFLGSEKYPDEKSYHQYVASHGGNTNAYTALEETNYHFDVSYQFLEPALDRFAQFFISPLFTESAVDREILAVNAEFEGYKLQDGWRLQVFNQYAANSSHAYHCFGVGNLRSLRDTPLQRQLKIRELLIQFYEKYYNASIMKLVILGRETLDDLESMVVRIFSGIRGKLPNQTSDSLLYKGFNQAKAFNTPSQYIISPIADMHLIKLVWPLKSYRNKWRRKPTKYIAHLLGHEATGSLLALLKKKGWGSELEAGATLVLSDMELFTVTIGLTMSGLEHVDDIIRLTYEYINLLSKHATQKWIFEELQSMGEIEFKFQQKNTPMNLCVALAGVMQTLPAEHVLCGGYLLYEYAPDDVQEVVSYLKPDNMIVQVVSTNYQGKTESIEDWFGTQYTSLNFDEKMLKELNSILGLDIIPHSSDLYLPQSNPFIPKDFTIHKVENPQKHPQLLKFQNEDKKSEHALFHVYHKLDSTFKLPRGHVMFQFCSPHSYVSPYNVVMTNLFVNGCSEVLNEEISYYAAMAGLNFSLSYSFEGFQLEVGGYNDKIPELIVKIFERMLKFKFDPDRFNAIKEQLIRDNENMKLENAYQLAQTGLRDICWDKFWNANSKLPYFRAATASQAEEFSQTLFREHTVNMLVQGNITKEATEALIQRLQNLFQRSLPISPQLKPQRRTIKYHKGITYYYQFNVENEQDINSAIWINYQVGLRDLRTEIFVDLLAQVLHPIFYDHLRTKQQLGYSVWAFASHLVGITNFCCVIQSPAYDPIQMDTRINEFLHQTFKSSLETMTEEQFQIEVAAVAAKKMEKFTKLAQEVKYHWEEISNETFLWDRRELYVEELKKITKEDLIKFFERFIISPSTRRRIACQVFGCKTTVQPAHVNYSDKHSKVILKGEERRFKESMALYPSKL